MKCSICGNDDGLSAGGSGGIVAYVCERCRIPLDLRKVNPKPKCERCLKIDEIVGHIEKLKIVINQFYEFTENPNISKDIVIKQYDIILDKLKS